MVKVSTQANSNVSTFWEVCQDPLEAFLSHQGAYIKKTHWQH